MHVFCVIWHISIEVLSPIQIISLRKDMCPQRELSLKSILIIESNFNSAPKQMKDFGCI